MDYEEIIFEIPWGDVVDSVIRRGYVEIPSHINLDAVAQDFKNCIGDYITLSDLRESMVDCITEFINENPPPTSAAETEPAPPTLFTRG